MTKVVHYTVAANWSGALPRPLSGDRFSNVCFFSGSQPPDTGWEYRKLPSLPEIDGLRVTRLVKAMPHRFFGDFTASIFCDATVQVRQETAENWASSPDSALIRFVQLPSRENLVSEFRQVASKRYDAIYTLEDQLDAYRRADAALMSGPVFWGGLIVRQHCDEQVVEFGERWWWNILRFSRRDQLSLPVALQSIDPSRLELIEGSEVGSTWHTRLPGVQKARNYPVGFRGAEKPMAVKTEEEKLMAEVLSLRRFIEQLLRTSVFVKTVGSVWGKMRQTMRSFRSKL